MGGILRIAPSARGRRYERSSVELLRENVGLGEESLRIARPENETATGGPEHAHVVLDEPVPGYVGLDGVATDDAFTAERADQTEDYGFAVHSMM
jgi:hypothetical protein